MIPGLILTTVFLTSVLSGVLGMAGGMILMATLVWVYSVAAAMILHGAVQATANGSRAWFLRQHIRWDILPNYAAGAVLAVGAFAAIQSREGTVQSRQFVDRLKSDELGICAADHRSVVDQQSEFREKGFEGHDTQPSPEP